MRHDGDELLDEAQVRLVESDVDLSVDEGRALVLGGLGDLGVAVGEVHDSDSCAGTGGLAR